MDDLADLDFHNIAINELRTIIRNTVFKYKHEPITLSSGQKSHYYFDIREIAANWYYADVIARAYAETIRDVDKRIDDKDRYYNIGGPESGGIPIMQTLIIKYQKLGFWIRKEPKKYGMRKQIEGNLGSYNIIVDDIVTTGSSVIKSINAIKDMDQDAKIIGVYPIIDRSYEFSGTRLYDDLQKIGIDYSPLFISKHFIVDFEKTKDQQNIP
jgi:orotate phosphoribosyltransferase